MREENIVMISDYLRAQFGDSSVEDMEVANNHVFLVREPEEAGQTYRLQVSEDFLDDTPPLEISEELDRVDLPGYLRRAGERTVFLGPEGAEVLEA